MQIQEGLGRGDLGGSGRACADVAAAIQFDSILRWQMGRVGVV